LRSKHSVKLLGNSNVLSGYSLMISSGEFRFAATFQAFTVRRSETTHARSIHSLQTVMADFRGLGANSPPLRKGTTKQFFLLQGHTVCQRP